MNYAVGCLLLLLVVLSVGLLLRIEGFAVGDTAPESSTAAAAAAAAAATPPAAATLNDLKNVSARITTALGNLNKLASKPTAIQGRINTLTFIKSALDNLIDLVTIGTLPSANIPVTSAAVTAFLANLDDTTKVLPPLISISSTIDPSLASTTATAAAAGPSPTNDALVKSLLASLIATTSATTTTVPSASSGTQSTPAATGTTLTATNCAPLVAANVKPYSDALNIMKAENKSLQNASIQRCPNMREYVRKDSIPCYNCSL